MEGISTSYARARRPGVALGPRVRGKFRHRNATDVTFYINFDYQQVAGQGATVQISTTIGARWITVNVSN